ncbi:MAG: UDP-2,3-diacylglucosamine diphosphatase LpxI, partial [Acidobacteria bacterium]|nr:UDP-2,3-diacylglucosamine diphosphatase LpxI [Acidobacteriota bacterium]
GLKTIQTMIAAGATCLSIEAGRTLVFDQTAIVAAANAANITISVTSV